MELVIEVTDRCFNNCVHCSSNASFNNISFLSLEIIKWAIDTVNPDMVILSGGEPFLHPSIENIISEAKNRSIKIAINTCGVFPARNIPPNILDVDSFYISWFGEESNIERYDQPLSAFKPFMHPFSLINWARVSKKEVFLNTVVVDEKQIFEIPRACFDLRVPVHIMRLVRHGRAIKLPVKTMAEQRDIADRILDQLDPARAIIRAPGFLCSNVEEVLPEDIDILRSIHPRCKVSHSLAGNECRSSEKRTLLIDGRIIGCVAGKGRDEAIGKYRACD